MVYVGLHVGMPVLCQEFGLSTAWIKNFDHSIVLAGGITGLAFWTVFFGRKALWAGVKRALQGGRSRDGSDPFSYRTVLIVMLLSFASFLALFVYGSFGERLIVGGWGRMIINLLGCLVVILVMLLTIMRMSGEQGFHYHSPWLIAFVISYVHYHYMMRERPHAEPIRFYNTQASFLSIGHVVLFGAYHNAFAPHLHVLYALKLANQNRTDPRDVMKAVGIALLLGVLVVIPLYLVVVHNYGFGHGDISERYENFFNYEVGHYDIGANTNPSMFNRYPLWLSIPAGTALIGVIMYLKRERVGFPLSPVGVIVGVGVCYPGGAYATEYIWFSILIVYLIKLMIYRWFGVGFFRKRVLPMVVFAMMGLMTGMLVYKMMFAALGRGFITGG
jgi:hypothetical protein